MKIVMPEYIEILSKKHLDELKSLGEVRLYSDYPKTDGEIIRRIGDAEIVLFKWIKISAHIIEKCPLIRYIITLSIGTNFVDSKKAQEKGIKIINCPTNSAQAVAEHIIGLMYAISRNIVEAQTLIRRGRWKATPYTLMGQELAGKRLGLVGYGRIGKRVAALAKGIGMKASFVNSKSSGRKIDDLITSSDYLSLSLPYTEKTYHLIDERRLGLLKRTAYIINTARGEIIDQRALLRRLRESKIAGAALDVFEDEPINETPSKEIIELASLPNVVATPHIGFNTREAAQRLGEEMLKNVKACLLGKPINVKN
jgi:D-3-phosphoglycerate dehydrogenase